MHGDNALPPGTRRSKLQVEISSGTGNDDGDGTYGDLISLILWCPVRGRGWGRARGSATA